MKQKDLRQRDLPFDPSPTAAAAVESPGVESVATQSTAVQPAAFGSAAFRSTAAESLGVGPVQELRGPVPELRGPVPELRGPAPEVREPAPEARGPMPRPGLAPGWMRARAEWFLLAAAVLLLGIRIARVPLLDPDEARYASASRSMLERGDLVVPYYNGVERLNKPALFYWLQAAAFRLLGPTAAAARLPSVAAALLVLLVVYLFARDEFGRDVAVRAGFILLTCPLFVLVGKTGITDMTLCLFVVLALGLWYRSHVGRGSRRLGWVGVSICLGLAFLVKGPVGIAVPCLVIAVFLAIRRDWTAFRPKRILSGAAVALAVFLPWVALLVYRLGSETPAMERVATAGGMAGAVSGTTGVAGGIAGAAWGAVAATPHTAPIGIGIVEVLLKGTARVGELLRRETIDRAIHGLDHPQPFFYYVVASLVAFFPWWCYLPLAAGRSLAAAIRHGGRPARDRRGSRTGPLTSSSKNDPEGLQGEPALGNSPTDGADFEDSGPGRPLPVVPNEDRHPAVLFLLAWMLTVLVFFSVVRGKLVSYILPAAPPLALLVGREWVRLRAAASGEGYGRGIGLASGSGRAYGAKSRPWSLAGFARGRRFGTRLRSVAGFARVRRFATRFSSRAEFSSRAGFGSEAMFGPASGPGSGPRPHPMTRWVLGGSALLGAFVIALLGYAVLTPPSWLRGFELLGASLGAAFLVVAAAPVLARRPQAALISLAGLMTVMLAVVPVVAEHEIGTRRSLRDLALEAGIADRPWSRVIAYKLSRPSLVFYGRRDVTIVDTPAALRSVLDPESLVVIDERRFDELGSDWQNAFRIVAVQGPVLAVAPIAPLPSADPPPPRKVEGSGGNMRGKQRDGRQPEPP